MGRKYAGILGLIAFAVIVVRGALAGGAASSTLRIACLCLFGFAALGYVLGRIGAGAVEQSARQRFKEETAEQETN